MAHSGHLRGRIYNSGDSLADHTRRLVSTAIVYKTKNDFWNTKAKAKSTTMRRVFIVLLAVIIANCTKACDICGCGVGNFNPYMFPHLVQRFVSIGYNYRTYETKAHDDFGNAMFNKEYY